MNRKIFLMLGGSVLFMSSQAVANWQCWQIPKCGDLGYTKTAGECEELTGTVQYLRCPFDNNKVYCPEDCSTYPLDQECNKDIGGGGSFEEYCTQCAIEKKWKYKKCAEGYWLQDGKCLPGNCSDSEFPFTTRPSNPLGDIKSCKMGGTTRYGYSSCMEGYTLKGGNCSNADCGPEYVTLTGCEKNTTCDVCPINGDCSDICMEGNLTKVHLTCKDGYVVDSMKCVRYKIGTVIRVNSQGKLNAEEGTPIGIVYYSNSTINGDDTRIFALYDAKNSAKMKWIDASTNELIGTTPDTNVSAENDLNGASHTKKIMEYATAKGGEVVPVAVNAVREYEPEVCAGNSLCQKGKWYLPAEGELYRIYTVWREDGGYKIKNTVLKELVDAGQAAEIKSDYYWSSTEYSSTNSWGLNFGNGNRNTYGKYNSGYVRPVLAF